MSEYSMKRMKISSKDILFLAALYANLIFGYQYVQSIKEEQRKTNILIAELNQRLKVTDLGFAKPD